MAVGFDYESLTCANAWRFVACRSCGHQRLHPRPDVAALPVIYPPTYYAYRYDEAVRAVARRGKAALDAWKLRGIVRACARPPASYLDVGCGDGRFLRALEKRGVPRARIHGIELDAAQVQSLRARGYRAHAERVERCDAIEPRSIDLATMFHVIEHVDDPAAVVRKLAGWLAPGGVLALETPNVESLDARLFRTGFWGGYHFPRHWHLFTPGSLLRLLREAGLDVVDLRFQTGHSFWMFSLHHRLRFGRRPYPTLARAFDPFRSLPLLVAFTAFDRLRAALGFQTSAMLALARKS